MNGMVFNLDDRESVVCQYLYEMRDVGIQADRARFRKNLQRVGQVLAFEISRQMTYRVVRVATPVANAEARTLSEHPLILTILRAGLPFHQGFLDVFDHADCGFIGAYRDEESAGAVTIKMNYLATPSLEGRHVIVADPMLATGSSLVRGLESALRKGKPDRIDVAVVIATPEGIRKVEEFARHLECPVNIWTAAIDEKLNDRFYIVPGLGDAGDLCFGIK